MLLGKKRLGVMIVLVGVLLSLPGVPGRGLMLMFIGFTLLDFQGNAGMNGSC
jgi:hypothetical protein